ncbi:hypothetical protein C8F04DRAFT_1257864 [Mycena alexandri]|uniref:F-box domain-containing protein n=1 Tax=Mycena alexandri TaxID=1745969 RepID=A0AAD6X2L1_9AGAR|nr:hypothetical protein C8F04DRAFT_1257864 [Mycena alexandri]
MAVCSNCGSSVALEDPLTASEALDRGTPYNRFLNSNDPPTDSRDVDLVDSIISQTESSMERVDDEITRLRQRLAQLEDRKTALSLHLARNKAILSPLRRMPPELLLEIFSWTLPSILFLRRQDQFDVTDVPWILGHISSNWRAVALSSPSLWSVVAVNYTGALGNPLTAYPLAMLETQLARAQKLKIHFYASAASDDGAQTEIFKFLAAQSSRWEELSISLTPVLASLIPSLRDRIPSLRRLWLQWEALESQADVELIDCFEIAPSLIDVGLYNEYRSIPIHLPAQQLTRYHLDAPWEVHEGLLQQAQNVVEARIDVRFDPNPWSESYEVIEISSLRRLYVSEPEVLNRLRAPYLEEVALYCRPDNGPDIVRDLHSLVLRSSCPIGRICLKGLPTTQITTNILLKVPSIVELGIIINDSDSQASQEVNSLMADFTVLDSEAIDKSVAPHLTCLFFGCDDESYIDYNAYLEMVKSRWKSEHCALRSATLLTDSNPGPDAATLEALNILREEGLDLFLLDGAEASEMMGGWMYASLWN